MTTRVHPTTKVDHKFDVEENYLEKNKLILEDVIIEDPQITKELKNGPYSNEATLISRHSSKNHASHKPHTKR